MGEYIELGGTRTDELGLVMLREAAMDPPEPRVHTVDLLGGDGSVDLTEVAGDVTYHDREMTFGLWNAGHRPMSEVYALLHGRSGDFRLSLDPGYTYTGRFSISSLDVHTGVFELRVVARPYKSRGLVALRANAAGGVRLLLDNGRARTQPTVEVYRPSVLSCGGHDWELDAGTWVLEDFWLRSGGNVVAVTTTPEYSVAPLSTFETDALSGHAGRMLCELAQGDAPLQEQATLSDLSGETLWSMESTPLIGLSNPEADPGGASGDTNIYFAYEWRDL